MNNNKGFTFVELIFSFALFLVLTTFLLPILTHVRMMQNERAMERYGYTMLQEHLYDLPQTTLPFEIKDSNYPIKYQFTLEEGYVKGCTNFPHRSKEELCLYAQIK